MKKTQPQREVLPIIDESSSPDEPELTLSVSSPTSDSASSKLTVVVTVSETPPTL